MNTKTSPSEVGAQIMENGRKWRDQLASVVSQIKGKMGSERWMKSSTKDKVDVGLELGFKVYVKPPKGKSLDDMGLGIFVPRYELRSTGPRLVPDAAMRAAGEREEV